MSKEYHPDFYVTESEEKQQEVLELSTLNTNAFNTLKDENKLIEYVLRLEEKLVDGENNELPQAFLMEMMAMVITVTVQPVMKWTHLCFRVGITFLF